VIDRDGLDRLIAGLVERGYEVIGPTVRDRAIVYEAISTASDLPEDWTDEQDGGHYRLRRRGDGALFEQAAHARAERCVDGEALAHLVPARPWDGPPGGLEVDRRHPPRLPDRPLPSRHRHRLQVGDPLIAVEIGSQELPAPERAVRAVARAVEDEGQRGPGLAVLGEAGRRVRVVVLHRDPGSVLDRAHRVER
jgi:hypothetical protein